MITIYNIETGAPLSLVHIVDAKEALESGAYSEKPVTLKTETPVVAPKKYTKAQVIKVEEEAPPVIEKEETKSEDVPPVEQEEGIPEKVFVKKPVQPKMKRSLIQK